MPSPSQHTIALFNKLIEGELSPQETEELIDWLGSAKMEPGAAELVIAHLKQSVAREQVSPAVSAMLEAKLPLILNRKRFLLRSLQTPWVRYAAAALVLLFAGMFFLLNRHPQQIAKVITVPPKIDIAPGKQGAILTLADGSTVVLDSMGNGVVATQGGTKVLLHNGQLAYNTGSSAGAEVAYNKMVTPRGRQFQLVLPDGTKVWLNAASSLRYPTVFSGKDRTVEVTGEAYFEVAKLDDPSTGKRIPFKVKVNEQTAIQVLGTHFNINSYADEKTVNTTLLEGSVQVTSGTQKVIIEPGQQAQVAGQAAAGIKVVADADVEKVMAWKNGVFNFQDASLEEVMRELQRWYNIDVVYEKGVPKLEFIGRMGRDLSLASVLNGLELSSVHFRIEEGRRLVILP